MLYFFLLLILLSKNEISIKNKNLELFFTKDFSSFQVIYLEKDTFSFDSYPYGAIRIYKGDSVITLGIENAEEISYEIEKLGIRVIFKKFKNVSQDIILKASLKLLNEEESGFEVIVDLQLSKEELKDFFYPPALAENKGTIVLPIGIGTLIPQSYKKKFKKDLPALSSLLTMPWFGVIREKTGFIAIIETPYDASLFIENDKDKKIGVKWESILDKNVYSRKLLYKFGKNLTYSDIANIYRNYFLKRSETTSSLRLDPFLGALLIPLGVCFYDKRLPPKYKNVHRTFESFIAPIMYLCQLGLKKAIIHLDGWGKRGYDNLHPFPLPPCPEAGGWEGLKSLSKVVDSLCYILELHDNYRDYFIDSPVFDEKFTIKDRKGESPKYTKWAGGLQSILCAKVALPFLAQVVDSLESHEISLKSYFLDVFSSISLDECFDSLHPMNRQECAEYRNFIFDYLRNRGYLVGSEDVVSWAIGHIEHSYKLLEFTWGKSVPLLSLVFHDKIIMPFDIGNGRDRNKILRCLLFGAMPIVRLEEAVRAYLKRDEYNPLFILTEFHKFYGNKPIQKHEILKKGVERIVYEDKTEVWVDFNKGKFKIKYFGEEADWSEMPLIPYKINIDTDFRLLGSDSIRFTIYWIPEEILKEDFKIFTHIADSSGRNIYLNLDHYPPIPTSKWKEKQIINDGPLIFELPKVKGVTTYYVYAGLFKSNYGKLLLKRGKKFVNKYLLYKIKIKGNSIILER